MRKAQGTRRFAIYLAKESLAENHGMPMSGYFVTFNAPNCGTWSLFGMMITFAQPQVVAYAFVKRLAGQT